MSTAITRPADERIQWLANLPYIGIHVAGVVGVGFLFTSATSLDITLCIGLYLARIFFITAGYHRYFSHRSYKMGRGMQFLMAFGGATAVQKGPLWWAANHRHHHKYSDQPEDAHSPMKGFWWSHMGWIMCNKFKPTQTDLIKDFAKYPELQWLNKYYVVPPIMLGVACFLIGGWSGLFVGFFLSTVITYHCTYLINSLTHLFGRRRYVTTDTSRNSLILALLTFGEGWHNNHHYYQSTANQGFFWWEIDISYYILKMLSWVGLVSDLRTPPKHVRDSNRIRDGLSDVGMVQARLAYAQAALYRAKRRSGKRMDEALEEARVALANAQAIAAEYVEERRKDLDELIESTAAAIAEFSSAIDWGVRDRPKRSE